MSKEDDDEYDEEDSVKSLKSKPKQDDSVRSNETKQNSSVRLFETKRDQSVKSKNMTIKDLMVKLTKTKDQNKYNKIISLINKSFPDRNKFSNDNLIKISIPNNLSVYIPNPNSTTAIININVNVKTHHDILLIAISTSDPSVTIPISNKSLISISESFSIGITILNIFVLDNKGNTKHLTANINVLNSIPPIPTFKSPDDIIMNTDNNSSTTIVDFSKLLSLDNIRTAPGVEIVNIIAEPSSGSKFNIGTTPVKCTIVDSWNQRCVSTFNITVLPHQPPTFTSPEPLSLTAKSPEGTSVHIPIPKIISPYPGNYYYITNNAPLLFPLGTTTVTFVVTDSYNLKSTCDVSVIIDLPAKPEIICPSNIEVLAMSPDGSVLNFEISMLSESDPNPTLFCSYLSGYKFPIGKTTVNCYCTDWFGQRSDENFFDITVKFPDPPIIHPIPNIIVLDGNNNIDFSIVATSDSDPNPIINYSSLPGSEFPIGRTIVTCIAKDWFGQESLPFSFDIIIYKPLSILCNIIPKYIHIYDEFNITSDVLNGYGPYVLNYRVFDNLQIIDETTYKSSNVGIANVEITVNDSIGNSSTFNNVINILPLPPILTLDEFEHTYLLDQNVNIQLLANGHPNIIYSNSSSCPLPEGLSLNSVTGLITGISSLPGTYSVEFYASNEGGDSNKIKFTINIPAYPTIECPDDIIVDANTVNGNIIYYPIPANIGIHNDIKCIPMSGSIFPIGSTIVNCTVTDIYEQQTRCFFTVTVRGPQETCLHILNEINTQSDIIKTTDNDTYLMLNDVIHDIQNSLDMKYWKNNICLNHQEGNDVFNIGKIYMNKLKSLIRTVNEMEDNIIINNIIVIEWMLKLTRVYQLIAKRQIMISKDNINSNIVQQSENSFLNGKNQIIKGRYVTAIDSFNDAWNKSI
jgi:hypothetical protein